MTNHSTGHLPFRKFQSSRGEAPVNSTLVQQREHMRTKGKLISWDDEKGFGFIKPTNGSAQVPIYINAFHNQNRRPETNQLVTHALFTDK